MGKEDLELLSFLFHIPGVGLTGVHHYVTWYWGIKHKGIVHGRKIPTELHP